MLSQIVSVYIIGFCAVVSSSLSFYHGFLLRPALMNSFHIHAIADDKVIGRQDFINDTLWAASSFLVTTNDNGNSSDNDNICQNGALMDESAVPGAYSSMCMGLPKRTITLPKYQERCRGLGKIPIHNSYDASINSNNYLNRGQQQCQYIQPGTIIVQQQAGGSGNTGMSVWNSGLLLTRLLDVLVDEFEWQQRERRGRSTKNENDNNFWMNQDVIELGTGTGVCSIAAHQLGARSVIATDGNPRVLELTEFNIRRNCYSTTSGDTSADPNFPSPQVLNIKTEPLQWGLLNAMDYSESASIVIGADLTYNPGAWRVLAETIATVLKTKNDKIDDTQMSNRCYALYLSIGHEGFNVNAEMDGFLSVCQSLGLVTIPDGVEGIDISTLLLNSLSEPEKRILDQSGGFRVAVLGRKEMNMGRDNK